MYRNARYSLLTMEKFGSVFRKSKFTFVNFVLELLVLLESFRKVNAKVSILRRIRKLIPPDIMIKLYKAFVLPHFEYASPLFVGLSKGLSAKLESTNAFALRTLLNHSKLTAYEELLKIAHIKSLEHRRIEQALILVYESIYAQTAIYSRGMFLLRSNRR